MPNHDGDEGSWSRRRALIERLLDDLQDAVRDQDSRLTKVEIQLAVHATKLALWSFLSAGLATAAIQAAFRWLIK